MDWITAAGTWLTALATVALAWLAWYQLGAIRKQLDDQAAELRTVGDREKQWRTIEACERYSLDPVVYQVKRDIWIAREHGKLDRIPRPGDVKQSVLILLNYLDAIGVGVRQGAYLESIVVDHLSFVIVDAVNRFVKGSFGDFGVDQAQYAGLIHLYDRIVNAPVSHSAVP